MTSYLKGQNKLLLSYHLLESFVCNKIIIESEDIFNRLLPYISSIMLATDKETKDNVFILLLLLYRKRLNILSI